MKILSGVLRGRSIPFDPHPGLRPTPDKVRKALIETLKGVLTGARVLDLYSGTGALGLEALSSGAGYVTFVELHNKSAAVLSVTLSELGLGDRSEVWTMDALKAIERLHFEGGPLDLIFADPPYEKGLAQKTLEAVVSSSFLKAGGWLVLETYKNEELPQRLGPLVSQKHRVYGDTLVHYYQKKECLTET